MDFLITGLPCQNTLLLFVLLPEHRYFLKIHGKCKKNVRKIKFEFVIATNSFTFSYASIFIARLKRNKFLTNLNNYFHNV